MSSRSSRRSSWNGSGKKNSRSLASCSRDENSFPLCKVEDDLNPFCRTKRLFSELQLRNPQESINQDYRKSISSSYRSSNRKRPSNKENRSRRTLPILYRYLTTDTCLKYGRRSRCPRCGNNSRDDDPHRLVASSSSS